MRSTPVGLYGQSFALVLALAATVQAGPINWYSSWSSTPAEIDIVSPVTKITLTTDPTPVWHTPPSFVAMANVTTYSTDPVTFTQANGSFQVQLTLYDGYVGPTPTDTANPHFATELATFEAQVAHLQHYTFTFNGYFSTLPQFVGTGEPSLSPTQNLLGVTWLPTAGLQTALSGISESHQIGLDTYNVSFAGYGPSDDGYAQTSGSMGFLVTAGGPGSPFNLVPEPGTLFLSGLGLSLCVLPLWRRRRPAMQCGSSK